MSVENQILLWTWIAWLSGPVIGLIGGFLSGLAYRHYNAKVDTNTTKPQLYHISTGIAWVIVIIGIIASMSMLPNVWQYVNMEEFSIRMAVSLLFCAIISEFTMIQVANSKKKEA